MSLEEIYNLTYDKVYGFLLAYLKNEDASKELVYQIYEMFDDYSLLNEKLILTEILILAKYLASCYLKDHPNLAILVRNSKYLEEAFSKLTRNESLVLYLKMNNIDKLINLEDVLTMSEKKILNLYHKALIKIQ